MDENIVRALQANLDAHNAFPYEAKPRRQLALTIASLEAMELENVRLDNSAADRAHEITMTAAPHNPVVLASRIQHLIASERWRRPETEELLSALKETGSLHPQTWMLEAVYASLIGDEPRLIRAVYTGLALDEKTFREFAERIGVVIQ